MHKKLSILVVLLFLVAVAAAQMDGDSSTPTAESEPSGTVDAPDTSSAVEEDAALDPAADSADSACDTGEEDIRDVVCEGQAPALAAAAAGPSCPSSPFAPPEDDDSTFIADCSGGLDTGCTFRDGSPLVFTIRIDRVIGDKDKLLAAGLLAETVTLQMPAFDVDFFGGGGIFNPERDRVSVNGNVVPGEFLQGDNGVWRLNEFNIPVRWLNFPPLPANPGDAVTPVDNTVSVEIDTANSELVWCTSIDWAAIKVEVPRPVVFVHGIFSNGGAWNKRNFSWVNRLTDLGIPNSMELNMGALDSIQNNAAKVAGEVASAKRRWGVDKVNLVCHSKGGLDSREFAEGSDSVERLIQLGTPNAGSPLADVAQGILVRAIGLPLTILTDLALPAGYQLTQPYMALYNATHGFNPDVEYTSLAGDYDPDCRGLNRINPFCHPIDRLLLSIAGPGDTIVPITSVHALAYAGHRFFQSSGNNHEATHTNLNDSAGVYREVQGLIQVFGMSAPATEDAAPSTARTETVIGSIQQGQVVRQTIPIDQATPAFFSLLYPSGDLDLALISPSGVRFDGANVPGNPDVGHEEREVLGEIFDVFNFAAPEVGLWTAEITAPSVTDPSGAVGFAVIGWIESPAITLHGALARANVHAGESLRLFGTLQSGGAPQTGAAVSARVGLPDGTAVDLALRDDGAAGDALAGDGVYTADFAGTAQSGNYRIVFQARSSSPAFSREDLAVATVSRSSSTIAGPFADSGVDTDGDGLFNQLRVQIPLDITAAGSYRLLGVLADSAGHRLDARVGASLAAGANTLALDFDGRKLFENRVDGPYVISLRLVEESDTAILPVDERADAHSTAAYSFRAFQHGELSLNGDGSSEGVDFDGNGRFDLLNVSVGVEVLRAGFYQWSARLADRNGTELGFDSRVAFFGAGANSLTFSFDGRAIGENGVNGPYFIRGLLVSGVGASLVVSNAFATEAFLASQFEGFAADTTPPVLQVAVSPSVLSPPNHRLVPIAAAITVSDDVDPAPRVELLSITSNEPNDGTGDGNTGADIQGAELGTDDRLFSLRAERSGSEIDRIYTVTYRARDAAGNETTASATVTVPHDQR